MTRNSHPNQLANLKPAWDADSAPRGGKDKGTRDRIGRRFLELLHADFAAHGEAAIPLWRENHLDRYMAGILSLLPKEATLNLNTDTALDDLSAEQLAALADGLQRVADALDAGDPGAETQAGPHQPAPLH